MTCVRFQPLGERPVSGDHAPKRTPRSTNLGVPRTGLKEAATGGVRWLASALLSLATCSWLVSHLSQDPELHPGCSASFAGTALSPPWSHVANTPGRGKSRLFKPLLPFLYLGADSGEADSSAASTWTLPRAPRETCGLVVTAGQTRAGSHYCVISGRCRTPPCLHFLAKG